ncbi:hypothetical protein ACX0G7_11390 [Flavitalea antarctica]
MKAIKPFFSSPPYFKRNDLQTVVERNLVAVPGEVTATHAGNLFGCRQQIKRSFMTWDFYQIEDGIIVASWHIAGWL